jgi:anti-sigma B factor antagonist
MSNGSMTIKVRCVGKVNLLDLEGRLIMGKPVEELKRQGCGLIESGATTLGVNLAKVAYLDSSGVGALATLWTSAKKAGAQCRFYAATPRLATILKITRLDTALEFLPDEAALLANS